MPRSEDLFRESSALFPGGVNSPVRRYDPYPKFMTSSSGSKLVDSDGKEYVDYCLGFGPMILGHGHPELRKALQRQVEAGVIFGTPSELEIKLARMISASVPSIRKMRFTNSGTEATMHAVRLARAFTRRNIILKFEGGYHGAHDYALIKAGSGALSFGAPSSPGIPEQVTSTVLVGRYNDTQSLRAIFHEHGNEIAAAIVEPVMGNAGFILPDREFLKELRQLTLENGSLLIFDEVITGYRFKYGAYQDIAGIRPDLTTMGKIIGGGLPIGLFGGDSEILDMISPMGQVYEAGTFSANPLTMAAGIATLSVLENSNYAGLSRALNTLVEGLSEILGKGDGDFAINSLVSAFQIFFGTPRVESYEDAMKASSKRYLKVFRGMLSRGVYLAPGQYETNFLSFSHSDEDIGRTLDAFRETIHDTR